MLFCLPASVKTAVSEMSGKHQRLAAVRRALGVLWENADLLSNRKLRSAVKQHSQRERVKLEQQDQQHSSALGQTARSLGSKVRKIGAA
jgi:hypothetical protein